MKRSKSHTNKEPKRNKDGTTDPSQMLQRAEKKKKRCLLKITEHKT